MTDKPWSPQGDKNVAHDRLVTSRCNLAVPTWQKGKIQKSVNRHLPYSECLCSKTACVLLCVVFFFFFMFWIYLRCALSCLAAMLWPWSLLNSTCWSFRDGPGSWSHLQRSMSTFNDVSQVDMTIMTWTSQACLEIAVCGVCDSHAALPATKAWTSESL